MKKNVASQVIGAQCITAADGSAFTGSVTCYVTIDGGTQAVGTVGSGAATHEGNGFQTYAPSQAETNGDHIGYTFIGTGMIPVTIQVYTSFPQTVDNATNISAIKTKTDFLPSATAGASGGLFIAGSNATTTVNFTGNLSGSVGSVTAAITLPTIPTNWISAAGIASSAITSAKFGSGAITSTVLAANAIGASQIAADAIGASELATDAVTEIVNAVWAAASRTLTAATNFNNLSSTDVAAAVWNAATATYGSAGSYGLLVETNLDAAVSGATAPTAAAVADAVWDELLSGHAVSGSTGEALSAAGSAGDPWIASLPGAYSAGQAGYIVGTNLDAPVSTVDTVVDGIKAVTDNLPNSGALTSLSTAAALATVDSNVDAILVDTGTTLPASIAALNDFDPASDTVDVGKINGSTEAATDLALSAATIVAGVAATGTLSTTQMTTNLAEATDDHYNGRIIIWTSGVLKDQATNITGYTGSGGLCTFTAVTEAPINGDTFVIV